MERFAFKIDKALKANLYKICRLCGIDNPDKVNILGNSENTICEDGSDPELWRKIQVCIGLTISKDDNMPQTMCTLCVDKVNDFFEFREMCFLTTAQTRKLLGLKEEDSTRDDIKPEFDVNNSLPSNITKRVIFDKRRRKRNCADTFTKVDIEDSGYKIEKFTTTSNQIKKKIRLSHLNNNTDPLTIGKHKPLTLMERRALALSKRKLESKLEIKTEFSDVTLINQMKSYNPVGTIPKLKKLKKCCTICEQRFISKPQLERHLSLIHVPNIPRYVCIACNETIKKGNEIKDHQLWHKLSKTPFICGLCGQNFLTGYSYSKHLRDHTVEVPVDLLVLDRQCPQCHETFVTNFLYNIHSCSINTLFCGGCDRIYKTEYDNLKHAPFCRDAYMNYSKHITPSTVSSESTVCIKNENDIEAAAEVLGHSINTPQNMAPVTSLTRVSPSVIMTANQCVAIPGNLTFSEGQTGHTDLVKAIKKSNKRSVSRKDLKRVDDLLKSTMDTFVSIKHEPEVHMDTDIHSEAESDLTDNDYVDDDSSLCNGLKIKQEKLDEENHYASVVANIKKELSDDAPNVERVPVLKLKITKEHGKLNSSIVDDNSRSEKKKKKKKRKDTEKDKDKDMNGNQNQTRTMAPVMPQPGLIYIKQEKQEDTSLMDYDSHNVNTQFSKPVMTSIPKQMEFKISRISGGVDFSLSTSTETNENEMHDIKPSRAELDRLLELKNIAGGADNSEREPHTKLVSDVASSSSSSFQNATSVEECSRFPHTTLPKIVSVCSGNDASSFVDHTNLTVKQERFDDSYGDEMHLNSSFVWNEHDLQSIKQEKEPILTVSNCSKVGNDLGNQSTNMSIESDNLTCDEAEEVVVHGSLEVERECCDLEIRDSHLDSVIDSRSEVTNNNKFEAFDKKLQIHSEIKARDLNCNKTDQPKIMHNSEKVTEKNKTEESISGVIIEDPDVSSAAQPFSDPEPGINNNLEDNINESEEELQNHLNHGVSDHNQLCATHTMPPINSPNLSNSISLQIIEDIAVSSHSSTETVHSADLPTSSTESVGPIESSNANEETENLINESAVLQRRISIERSNSNFIIDDSNINEIAENNNNANIERELLDDHLTRTVEIPDHHEDMS